MTIEVKIPVKIDIDEIIKQRNITAETPWEDAISETIDWLDKMIEGEVGNLRGMIWDHLTYKIPDAVVKQAGVHDPHEDRYSH